MKKSLAVTILVACSAPATRAPAPVQTPATPAPVPAVAATATPTAPAPAEDPYLWLEDINGEKPIAWARAQSDKTAQELQGVPTFATMRDRALAILDSKESFPTSRSAARTTTTSGAMLRTPRD
jgi:prolyl oligopeptidase